MERRIVITGIGVISTFGTGKDILWENVRDGISGIRRTQGFDVEDYSVKISGECLGVNPEEFITPNEVKRTDRYIHFAYAAAKLCVEDSGIDLEKCDLERFGVIMGTGIGGLGTLCADAIRLDKAGPRKVSPFYIPASIANMSSGMLSIQYGLKGPNFVTVTACASSTHAMGESLNYIRRGLTDLVMTGGSEAAIVPSGYAGFANMGALSKRNDEPQRASRPFDRERDGFVIGEGGVVFIFEEREHAKKRNAKIYGEVVGYGNSADAYHITAPAPGGEGAVRCMNMAIKDAGISPDDINYINAHGTSTPYNDKTETVAIKTVFGDRAYKIPISSTKSVVGHLLGGSGAIELSASLMGIQNGMVHQTANYEFPDPECDLDYVPGESREHKVNYMLKNSFGFGGQNASLVVKAP
ncbi:MAG: beta-ketoacyl-ACP synthase II [bacterium]